MPHVRLRPFTVDELLNELNTRPEYQAELAQCQRERDALAEALRYPTHLSPNYGIDEGKLLDVVAKQLNADGHHDLYLLVINKAQKEKAALGMLDKE